MYLNAIADKSTAVVMANIFGPRDTNMSKNANIYTSQFTMQCSRDTSREFNSIAKAFISLIESLLLWCVVTFSEVGNRQRNLEKLLSAFANHHRVPESHVMMRQEIRPANQRCLYNENNIDHSWYLESRCLFFLTILYGQLIFPQSCQISSRLNTVMISRQIQLIRHCWPKVSPAVYLCWETDAHGRMHSSSRS